MVGRRVSKEFINVPEGRCGRAKVGWDGNLWMESSKKIEKSRIISTF